MLVNCSITVYIPTDDLEQLDFTSKVDAIDDSESTMNACVVTPVQKNSKEKGGFG